ncbi:MAG: DegT/DnrJ/EryC1/StrS family aminotransferase [Candidatus Omnitrophota bacterium]
MTIPFVDLKRQYISIKKEIDDAIQGIITNTSFIMGPDIKELEKEFAIVHQAKFGVGVSSGTSALFLALLALGIKEGDEVITVANTFIATAEAISQTGAKPVFVDILEDNYNIDPKKIKEKITKKTKAVIAVHLYGHPADMDAVNAVAKEYNLKVIEDAAQAHLAEYKNNPIGTLSDASCFSFFPGKNLGAYGDAGMVLTNNEELAKKIAVLRNHGRLEKYEHLMVGYNERLDTLQAAILRVKLKYLKEWTEKRRRNAALYNELLKDAQGIVTPRENDYAKSAWHLYVIRSEKRDAIKEALQKNKIQSGIHYPIPLHLQPAYKCLGYKEGDFPVSENYSLQILSLPMFPELTEQEITQVVEVVKQV